MKKLKIKFVKFEKALAAQILEQENLPFQKDYGNVRIIDSPVFYEDIFWLRGEIKEDDLNITSKLFESNKERDAFLKKTIDSISNELFSNDNPDNINIGDLCWCSNNGEQWELCNFAGKSSKVLGLDKRWLVYFSNSDFLCRYKYVKKESVYQPNIVADGDIILATWEEK